MGEFNQTVIEKSNLAPSACNSQSWKVKVENNTLYVYRDKNIKTIEENKTVGIIIVRKDDKYIMEYCSDERILTREYNFV